LSFLQILASGRVVVDWCFSLILKLMRSASCCDASSMPMLE